MSEAAKRVSPSFPDKRQMVRRLRLDAEEGKAIAIVGLSLLDHLDALPVDRRPAPRSPDQA